jgi:hypothetical protein
MKVKTNNNNNNNNNSSSGHVSYIEVLICESKGAAGVLVMRDSCSGHA